MSDAIETANMHRVLVNVNALRKAKLPRDEGEMRRRIVYIEKLLAEAQDYEKRNGDKLALADEEARRAQELRGPEALRKLKGILPRRDKARTMAGAWKGLAAEAAEVLKRYREGLDDLLAGRGVTTYALPTLTEAVAVATSAAKRAAVLPRMPMMPHR